MKIIFTETMYNSPDVDEHSDYYKWSLKNRIGKGDFYAIVKNDTTGRTEIIKAKELWKRYYRIHTPTVIGLAGSHDEAVAVVVSMLCAQNGLTLADAEP